MFDRQEVDRADEPVGAHRVHDVLRIGPRAGVVVDLGADDEAHPAAQPLGDDGRVGQVDAGGLGRAVEVARLGEFEGAADQVDRGRIFEGQVVDVVGNHQETGLPAQGGVIEPQEQHSGGVRDRALLGVQFVLAFGMPVGIRNRRDAGVLHAAPGGLVSARTVVRLGAGGASPPQSPMRKEKAGSGPADEW